MSQVYQPVMLMELLKSNGQASTKQIAQAILNKDPTQIEYFTAIVKNMVGKVLTKNSGITKKLGETYFLIGASELTNDQVDELISLCKSKITEFEAKRGDAVWSLLSEEVIVQSQVRFDIRFLVARNFGLKAGLQKPSQRPNYLGFFFSGACANAEPAVVFAALVAVGLLSCLDATLATGLLVCFGLEAMIDSLSGVYP